MSHTYTVTIVSEGVSFQVAAGEPILAAARRAGVWLPFECGWGSCTTCKATLVEGEIRELFPEAPAIKPRDRRRKRILLCQSTPLSNLLIKARPQPEPLSELHTQDYQATLVEAKELVPNIRRFRFRLDRAVHFRPGQYAIFHLDGNLRRCYSMSNLPGARELEFIPKYYARPGTERLFALKPGDEVAMELPYGAMYWRESTRDPVFIAGGTGIAPILSLLREVVAGGKLAGRQLSVFYGAQTPQELVCLDELEALVEDLPQAGLTPAVVEPPANWRGEVGFVTNAVSRHLSDMRRYKYYIAGPPPMVNAALDLLNQHQVPVTHIHYDSFG